jgi:methionyl-tRNA formyltransferase
MCGLKIVFLGTTSFGIPALDALAQAGHEIVGIVSRPAREKGRGLKIIESDIVLHAGKMGYKPVFCPQDISSGQFLADLKNCAADLFVVVAFRILPKEIFSIPALGTYNIHASLLPRFRGPAPIQRAIAAGEKETGITVFRIDKGIDTGNIVLQKKTPIGDDEMAPILSARLAELGAQGICEAVSLVQNKTVEFSKQDEMLATAAPKLVKSEGKISWDLPARQIHNMVRAFAPFPGTYTFLDGARVGIEETLCVDPVGGAGGPGTVLFVAREGFDVRCGTGALRIITVRPEGKKSMRARDFANGRNLVPGTKFA